MTRIKIILSLLLLATAKVCSADQPTVQSPDQLIRFKLFVQNKQLSYSVRYKGQLVVGPSPIRMSVNQTPVNREVQIGKIQAYQLNENYSWYGVHSTVQNHFNAAKIALSAGRVKYTVDIRVFNDGVAFRLIVPGKTGVERIVGESTVFTLPEGTTAWYHNINAHYEGVYEKRNMDIVRRGDWAAPPVTFQLQKNSFYLSITEADLKNYGGMALQTDGKRDLVLRLPSEQPVSYPYKLRYSAADTLRLSKPARIKGTITTPWRVVMIAENLNNLVNNDMVHNLCPPPDPKIFPQGIKTSWIKPGPAVWKYLDGGGQSTLEEMKEYSRLAADLGFKHNILEGFWHKWTDAELRELVQYSAVKGIDIWLWEHSKNLWDGGKRHALFQHCHDLGIRGLKIDFFDHEAKDVIDLYQAILRETAGLQIMVDFHGANKPTGQERTWPNELTREAVKGMEASKLADRATHEVTLPFTRFIAGPAEYTPVNFGERRKNTSWAHQVASAAILSAPLLTYAASPEHLLQNPAVEMIKSIPSVWDQTVVLPGSAIGEMAVFARRKGNTWFLAVMNGARPKNIDIQLDFLGNGSYKVLEIKDKTGQSDAVEVSNTSYTMHKIIHLELREGGGYIAKFER
ncbi:glycoside hydrolase [Pedobacter sp. HMWF019]|uniref:glycoside hydrolase family 97 protein n=1 Tax=Pedobacter sp. HMWF019 TaxID=2056856 RepID=UPI000D34F1E8|nr:glycoside hydrolase family 97 protein [Pedobacter sp. HMWF019]PTT02283.1 glycoside hydrolase [Pedobacter sp. HMWF019]